MPLKVFIALEVPIRFKRIMNGERIIEQTGPDVNKVDVHEGEAEGEPRFEALIRLLDGAEREFRGSLARKRKHRKSSNPAVQSRRGQSKTGAVPSRKPTEFAPGRNFQSWRGRREQNPTGSEPAPVLVPKIAYVFPSFSLTWPLAWAKITNGERVMEDLAAFPEGGLSVPAEALAPESSNPVVLGVDGSKIPPRRPIRAVITYAQP